MHSTRITFLNGTKLVLSRETKWKARKFHEAALIYMGGDQVVSAPIMDIDPI
jgi:hypothetical protein